MTEKNGEIQSTNLKIIFAFENFASFYRVHL